MKLLLTSAGICNDKIAGKLEELTGQKGGEIKLAFVPTAGNVEEGDKYWLVEDYNNLKKRGYWLDIVDISALPRRIWEDRMNKANVIILGGGNTFYLMHWIRKSGLGEILPGLLKDRVYAGISAGSMVVSPSIFLTSDKPVFDEDRVGAADETGLGWVDFYVRPHYGSGLFPKARREHVEKAAKNTDLPIYAIDDQTAVAYEDGKVTVASEGCYEVFNQKSR